MAFMSAGKSMIFAFAASTLSKNSKQNIITCHTTKKSSYKEQAVITSTK